LAIAPIPGDHDGARLFGRRALVAIAVFQALHVYPVAGSQLGFASFLLIPAGVIGVVDAIQVAREHLAAVGRIAVIVVPLVLIAGFVTDDRFDPGRVRDAYEAETALGLPGAGWVRGLSPQVSAYRSLTQALRRHCDTFFSIPGLNSFYIFTEEEPPTGFNVGPWMYVLTGDEQRDVVRRLRRVDRLCVLRNDDELAFWQGNRPPPDGPLVRYLEGLTYPVANVANYSVKARPLAG